ncbi:hypothetical protein FRC12_014874, partial [Ceratobasidium sp. 428]
VYETSELDRGEVGAIVVERSHDSQAPEVGCQLDSCEHVVGYSISAGVAEPRFMVDP